MIRELINNERACKAERWESSKYQIIFCSSLDDMVYNITSREGSQKKLMPAYEIKVCVSNCESTTKSLVCGYNEDDCKT